MVFCLRVRLMKILHRCANAVLAILVVVLIVLVGARVSVSTESSLAAPPDIPDAVLSQIETVPEQQSVPTTEPESAETAAPAVTSEPTPEPLPELPDIDLSQWQYRLVNTDNLLESDYEPELTLVEGSQYFDSRASDALNAFIAGAREAGLTVVLTSSYRSYAVQQYLFNNKVYQTGSEEAAAKIVAIPGTSEHQLGLAADIVDGYYQYMNESLADTELSKWMYEHCWEYGFILRYPQDKQEITKIMFEPWHFRYVGVEAAKYIMENGLCLEEFIALYN